MEEREEKLVAAKNEENAKVSGMNIEEEENLSQVIEKPSTHVPLKFNYKDGKHFKICIIIYLFTERCNISML